MNADRPNTFALNPADYGLPTREELRKLRIWDIHYHGLWEGHLKKHEETMVYVERMGIERVLSLDIAGNPADPLGKLLPAEKKKEIRKFLETHSDRVSGLIPIDPGDALGSCQKVEEWVEKGPCVGIKYYGGNPKGIPCSHTDNDVIIRQAAKLNALVHRRRAAPAWRGQRGRRVHAGKSAHRPAVPQRLHRVQRLGPPF